ncbi:MAG: hypothetical protein GDA50_04625 [Alphaproteobacteria bacterium GM202ARS2]|nr:hypothetical protein [Alphaproteobacteria bacterium GM202ARS2]
MIKRMPMALWIVPIVVVVVALILNFLAPANVHNYLLILYYPSASALLALVLIFIGFVQYQEDSKDSGLWTIAFFTAAALMVPLFFITMSFSILALLKSSTEGASVHLIGNAWETMSVVGLITAALLLAHFMIVRGSGKA